MSACDFSTWLGLLTTWWPEVSHASHLTAGFLEAAALLPILFVLPPKSMWFPPSAVIYGWGVGGEGRLIFTLSQRSSQRQGENI